MHTTPVKAIAVFDRRESFRFSESIVADGSVDCHLIDVEDSLVDVEKFDSALKRLQTEQIDVVLLDSALPWAHLQKMTMRVRDIAPDLPVVLLPNIAAEDDSTEMSPASLHRSANAIAETTTKAIRYARDQRNLPLQLLRLALKDELTGLHNRRGFLALAKRQLSLARTLKRQLLLFFADVDGLKQINDRFGHHEGDRALQRTAVSFKKTFRNTDVTARLCGDEFVALMLEEPTRNVKTITRRLQRNLLRHAVREPRYLLSVSVGIARFDPEGAASLQDLMIQADKALYVQKRKRHPLAQPTSALTLADVKQWPRLNAAGPDAKRLPTFDGKVKLPPPIVRQQRSVGALQDGRAG
jgi:diguanylate cyclase (GGDEF)-like protein